MRIGTEQTVGTFVVGGGQTGVEYEIVVRPRILPGTGIPTSADETFVPVNLTLDSETRTRLKDICRYFRIPRYLALEHVMKEIAATKHVQPFTAFYEKGEYVEPRRIGGQQSHFKLSVQMNELFSKLSWKYAEGNKSRIARAAVAYILSLISNPWLKEPEEHE